MKLSLIIIVVLCRIALGGEAAVDQLPVHKTEGNWLSYDDGTAAWITWSGTYRGVWFNTEDFVPGNPDIWLEQVEFWFYHTMCWDYSHFFCEIWNGDVTGPEIQLLQTWTHALHYCPTIVDISPALLPETNFWCIINTELSSGGWPSPLGDGTPSTIVHSFLSDDFVTWEPWTPPTGTSDYFIRVNVGFLNLDATTWGSLKATF
ncbi:MAG: hypothetical protein KAH31_11220 [Candidatus Sabulitectum sp.]|nr:hypothetical protein [Candidatus Sabulitectum sp.]